MIILTLPYPLSANRYWASRVIKAKANGKWMAMTYVTPEARDYKSEIRKLCVAAGICTPFSGRVAIEVQLYPHRPLDFRTRMRKLGEAWDDGVQCLDLDNANKVLLDALKGVVIEDDRWVRRLRSERMEPDGEARVVVTISQIAAPVVQGDLLGAQA